MLLFCSFLVVWVGCFGLLVLNRWFLSFRVLLLRCGSIVFVVDLVGVFGVL